MKLDETHHLQLLSAIVDSSDDAIFSKTLDGIITSWNQAAEKFYGYTAAEAIGRNVDLIVPADRRREQRDLFARLRQGEVIRHLETKRQRRDGTLLTVSISLSPVRAPGGELIGVASITRDITSRGEAEERFRVAVEASPTGILMVDEEGKILLVNGEMERMFGYRRDELIGQPVEMLVPQSSRPQHPALRGEFGTAPSRRRMGAGRDLFGVHRDGTEFPVEVGLTPLPAREGLRVLGAVNDITLRKQAEDSIARHAAELQRSNAELAQFAYIASHDLQEPLRMVSNFTSLLAERYSDQLDERANKYIRYAVEGATRMQQLVNDLLQYSRAGTEAGTPHPTDAAAVLNTVLEGLRISIEESRAVIEVGELPSVLADPLQLGQVLQNLIGNALKFREPTRAPRIAVAAQRDGGEWRFSITDNGIGIEAQYSTRVFEMFQRLHARSRYEGSGIGLALARKIVQRHGGRIWFESEPGTGSTFYFTYPAVPS